MNPVSGKVNEKDILSGIIKDEGNLSGAIGNKEILQGNLSSIALRGYSAYQIAVMNGFEGTAEEWLQSLTGESVKIEVVQDDDTAYILKFSVKDEEYITPNLRILIDTELNEESNNAISNSAVFKAIKEIDVTIPIPTETTRGGIIAKERTTENNEVVIDKETGKAYVGGGGGIDVNSLSDRLLINESGQLDINVANNVEEDNTRPVTSAAVYVELGNIDALLKSI